MVGYTAPIWGLTGLAPKSYINPLAYAFLVVPLWPVLLYSGHSINQSYKGYIMKMTSKLVTKRNTQAMIKAMRGAGFVVTKIDAGYKAMGLDDNGNEALIFRAMIGSRGYLVRYASDLFA